MKPFNPYKVVRDPTHLLVLYYNDVVYKVKLQDNPHSKINNFILCKMGNINGTGSIK
jgi:hypothetical protein